MKSLKMKELLNEILDKTLAYYDSEDKLSKSKDGGGCFYVQTCTGNKCAVGRYFEEEFIKELSGKLEESDDPRKLSNGYYSDELWSAAAGDVFDFQEVMPLDSVLIDRVKGVPLNFWNELQQLHDSVLFKSLENYHLDRVVKGIKEDIKKGKYE